MKPLTPSEAAHWINQGYEDFAIKGLTSPEWGRYSNRERILAHAGFNLAKEGYLPILSPEDL